MLNELIEKLLVLERIERRNAQGRSAAKRALKNIADALAVAADMARICSAELAALLAQKVRQLTMANDTGLIDAREELRAAYAKAKEASDAARSARQRAK
jgi:hypothetical protein